MLSIIFLFGFWVAAMEVLSASLFINQASIQLSINFLDKCLVSYSVMRV